MPTILTVSMPADAAQRLKRMIDAGELTELAGFQVLGATIVQPVRILMRDVWGARFTPDNEREPELDADGDPIDPPTQPVRELLPEERAAIEHDADVQSYRAGASAARSSAALFGLKRTEERTPAILTYGSEPYARGWTTELEQVRRETLEAVHGVCADCETPLENGVCLRCLEG